MSVSGQEMGGHPPSDKGDTGLRFDEIMAGVKLGGPKMEFGGDRFTGPGNHCECSGPPKGQVASLNRR